MAQGGPAEDPQSPRARPRVAQFFGVGPAARCGDPEPSVRRSLLASVVYHPVRSHRRQHGATRGEHRTGRWRSHHGGVGDYPAALWSTLSHLGGRASRPMRPRATPAPALLVRLPPSPACRAHDHRDFRVRSHTEVAQRPHRSGTKEAAQRRRGGCAEAAQSPHRGHMETPQKPHKGSSTKEAAQRRPHQGGRTKEVAQRRPHRGCAEARRGHTGAKNPHR